jgi:PAS domain S-box-containing protein
MKRTRKESQRAGKRKEKKGGVLKPRPSGAKQMEDVQKLVQLLQVNQVELEHQNLELRIAEEELETSRSKYVNLFDFSPIPYFALDPDGVIKEVNLSAARMFGIDRNRLIGKNITAYVPSGDRNTFKTFMTDVFASSVKQSCRLRLTNKDKSVFHVLLEGLKPGDTLEADQRCQIALIDLTEYKKLEDTCKELSEKLSVFKTPK